ncbi:MAG: VanW family protein [Firmicutes bacterium]|nr:VanW family protein [Bacillota bacterium]
MPYETELSAYSTKYTGADTLNRNYNMNLAVSSLNGEIIEPGETLSYNSIILSKSRNGADYRSAGILVNGSPSTGRGGGICQVSSTLFQAALYAGMTIVERYSHSARIDYLPPGRDATVSWGTVDFVFRNDLDIPVKIDATMGDGVINIKFLSQMEPPYENLEVSVYNSGRGWIINRKIDGVEDYSSKSRYL